MAQTLAKGQLFAGRFRVVDFTFAADVAEVYEVSDTTDGQACALELITGSAASNPDAWEAFQKQAREAAELDSSVFAQVHEFGTDDRSGTKYLVREFVRARSIKARARPSSPLTPTRVSGLLSLLAPAFARVHQAGLVHRGLDPENVHLAEGPAGAVASITGFGHAELRSGPALPIGWSPPEAIDQAVKPAPESDTYSLALVAFFALTGHSFFKCVDSGKPTEHALRLEQRASRPASKRAAELGVSIPSSLDAVFSRALAASFVRRFSSVQELADAFAGAMPAGAGESIRPPPAASRSASMSPPSASSRSLPPPPPSKTAASQAPGSLAPGRRSAPRAPSQRSDPDSEVPTATSSRLPPPPPRPPKTAGASISFTAPSAPAPKSDDTEPPPSLGPPPLPVSAGADSSAALFGPGPSAPDEPPPPPPTLRAESPDEVDEDDDEAADVAVAARFAAGDTGEPFRVPPSAAAEPTADAKPPFTSDAPTEAKAAESTASSVAPAAMPSYDDIDLGAEDSKKKRAKLVLAGLGGLLGILLVAILVSSGSEEESEAELDAVAKAAATPSVVVPPPPKEPPPAEKPPPKRPEPEPKREVATVKFACEPGCDQVSCDGVAVDNPSKGIDLKPGKHTCVASKAGYLAATKALTVVAGEDEDVAIELQPKPRSVAKRKRKKKKEKRRKSLPCNPFKPCG